MSDAYDMIDRFLRNNLGSDEDYAEYSNALDSLCRAQPAPAEAVPQKPKLIGWRTSDYLMETSDKDKADNWAVHNEILPIFEGDPYTKLVAAHPQAAPMSSDTLYLLRRLLANRSCYSRQEFEDEMERIISTAPQQGEAALAEADLRAGAAERELASCRDDLTRLNRVRDQMKAQWGVDRYTSFDVVWAEALKLKQQAEAVSLPQQVMVDMVPPATARDRWMYEQGRLAERDPRTHAAPQQAEAVSPDVEVIRKALERAFIMGQNYWADADSESYSANKRSDVTRQKFNAMRDEVCAAIAQQKGGV